MSQSKGISQTRKYHYKQEWSSQASTNSFVDLGDSWDISGLLNSTIEINNTGDTNDIDYQVLGSLDDSSYDISIDSGTIGEDDYKIVNINSLTDNAYIPFLKIQIKSTVADNHSSVTVIGVAI